MKPIGYILRVCAVGYMALALGACEQDKPLPPLALKPAPAELMAKPEELPLPPDCFASKQAKPMTEEAKRACRLAHHADVRNRYAGVVSQVIGLQARERELHR